MNYAFTLKQLDKMRDLSRYAVSMAGQFPERVKEARLEVAALSCAMNLVVETLSRRKKQRCRSRA